MLERVDLSKYNVRTLNRNLSSVFYDLFIFKLVMRILRFYIGTHNLYKNKKDRKKQTKDYNLMFLPYSLIHSNFKVDHTKFVLMNMNFLYCMFIRH